MTSLHAELAFTLELVRECGEVAMRYWKGGARVLAVDEQAGSRAVRPVSPTPRGNAG